MLTNLEAMVQYCQLPFYVGFQLTIGDIVMAPYMARMHVLEHYRGFKIPDTAPYWKIREWKRNLLAHGSVKATIQPKDKIIQAYSRYANCTVRNNWYYKVFPDGKEKWDADNGNFDPYNRPSSMYNGL